MIVYKINNEEEAQRCNQRLLHRDTYCGENLTNIVAYAEKRVEIEPEEEYYHKLFADLKEKQTERSFIGIWQYHSDGSARPRQPLTVKPFFTEKVHIYNGGQGQRCYAQTCYFLLEEVEGMLDAEKRTIYKDMFTGEVFCFDYYGGSPASFASLRMEAPL